MSGYDYSQDVANELLEDADKLIDELVFVLNLSMPTLQMYDAQMYKAAEELVRRVNGNPQ